MNLILVGESGSGKSSIEKILSEKYGFNKIVSCTTRSARSGERNGEDYWFIVNDYFQELLDEGKFAEYEEYSQGRFYGSLKTEYAQEKNNVVVLTPNGIRQLKRNMPELENICVVYVTASLSNRMIRYIERCGETFNLDDKNEMAARAERDAGMFLGMSDEADLTVDNDGDIDKAVDRILDYIIKNYGGKLIAKE